jgi:hypothetical protein
VALHSAGAAAIWENKLPLPALRREQVHSSEMASPAGRGFYPFVDAKDRDIARIASPRGTFSTFVRFNDHSTGSYVPAVCRVHTSMRPEAALL